MVLSTYEVIKVLQGVPNCKHRLVLRAIDATELRVSEVTHLRVHDVDSAPMRIRGAPGQGAQRTVR